MMRDTQLSEARSFLFVPGNRPDRFHRAVESGADMIIIDLEDAVDEAGKNEARAAVVRWLETGRPTCVRVNGVDTPHHMDDIAAISRLPGLRGIVLPKAESADACSTVSRLSAVPVIPLIETVKGLADVREVAAAHGVARLALGHLDLALDLGSGTGNGPMLLARSLIVLAARLAHLPPPIDGVTTALKDTKQVTEDFRHSHELGFGAKLLLHPHQVKPTHSVLKATPAQRDWALRVLASVAHNPGAAQVDGAMVDAPIIARAKQILDQQG